MTIINIQSLGVILGDPLFKDLTFTISRDDRIGLGGANGRGGSALMGCLPCGARAPVIRPSRKNAAASSLPVHSFPGTP